MFEYTATPEEFATGWAHNIGHWQRKLRQRAENPRKPRPKKPAYKPKHEIGTMTPRQFALGKADGRNRNPGDLAPMESA